MNGYSIALLVVILSTSFPVKSDDRKIVYLDGKAVYEDTLNKPNVKPQEATKEDIEKSKVPEKPVCKT